MHNQFVNVQLSIWGDTNIRENEEKGNWKTEATGIWGAVGEGGAELRFEAMTHPRMFFRATQYREESEGKN